MRQEKKTSGFVLITKEFDGNEFKSGWMKFMLTMILMNVDNLCCLC